MNQNEPVFLNLYIRNAGKQKTFSLSKTYQVAADKNTEKT